MSALLYVQAVAYIASGTGSADYWAEGEAARAEVQRTDENEVRIGLLLRDSESDDATIYLTVAEASRLAHMLGIAVLANEAAAHEAASL